jgi:hypothetical protein
VISGALVLVAAVLLVVGIISSITLVYAAIGLSIVSAVFLLVGVFQRPPPAAEPRESESDFTRRSPSRDEDAESDRLTKKPARVASSYDPEPEADEADDPPGHIDLVDAERDESEYEDADAVEEIAADFPLEKANADFEARSAATGADVLVISGRPRYHVGGCEFVEGNDDSEPLEINEARELGFTPCGACRPNETLARSAAGKEHAPAPTPTPAPSVSSPEPEPEPEPAPVAVAEPQTTSFEPAPVTVAAAPVSTVGDPQQNNHRTRRTPTRKRTAPATEAAETAAQVAAPAPPAEPAAPAPPAQPAPPAPPPVATEPEPAAAAPAVAAPPAAAAAPEVPAAGRAARSKTVLAVASTKEYHRAGCELLVGAETEEMTRASAIRQAYLACGVCRP